jgi:SpoVK/Ycf46/Vps4 family AAA+-type ATPase
MVWDHQMCVMDTQAFVNLKPDEARVIVSNDDFDKAKARRKPSVTPESLQKYSDWSAERGAD